MVESFDLPDEDFLHRRRSFEHISLTASLVPPTRHLAPGLRYQGLRERWKGGTGYEKALERGRCSRWIDASLWSRFGTMGWRSRWAVWWRGAGEEGGSRLDGWRASVRGRHGSGKRNHR